ncbi:BTB domain-containing protein [Mycena venus]|uniref:BTB domain-containing protein n=1 Tax=Mycena venus TaxID=2733690 RepID=A0A8H6XEK8_9AGAR|nr:BTB domain-containing protein [Mycena venus]
MTLPRRIGAVYTVYARHLRLRVLAARSPAPFQHTKTITHFASLSFPPPALPSHYRFLRSPPSLSTTHLPFISNAFPPACLHARSFLSAQTNVFAYAHRSPTPKPSPLTASATACPLPFFALPPLWLAILANRSPSFPRSAQPGSFPLPPTSSATPTCAISSTASGGRVERGGSGDHYVLPVLPFLRIPFTEDCTSLDQFSEYKARYLADVGSWNISDPLGSYKD